MYYFCLNNNKKNKIKSMQLCSNVSPHSEGRGLPGTGGSPTQGRGWGCETGASIVRARQTEERLPDLASIVARPHPPVCSTAPAQSLDSRSSSALLASFVCLEFSTLIDFSHLKNKSSLLAYTEWEDVLIPLEWSSSCFDWSSKTGSSCLRTTWTLSTSTLPTSHWPVCLYTCPL